MSHARQHLRTFFITREVRTTRRWLINLSLRESPHIGSGFARMVSPSLVANDKIISDIRSAQSTWHLLFSSLYTRLLPFRRMFRWKMLRRQRQRNGSVHYRAITSFNHWFPTLCLFYSVVQFLQFSMTSWPRGNWREHLAAWKVRALRRSDPVTLILVLCLEDRKYQTSCLDLGNGSDFVEYFWIRSHFSGSQYCPGNGRFYHLVPRQ